MAQFRDLLDRRRFDRALAHWDRLADAPGRLAPDDLRRIRSQARKLGHAIDRARAAAEGRLIALPGGAERLDLPEQTDWATRPAPWRLPLDRPGATRIESPCPLGGAATVFHDCARSEMTLRQHRNADPALTAPFALSIDVYRFDGSFLSLVIDYPEAALDGLGRSHVMEVVLTVELETPLEIYGRLNLQFGPNSDQMVREMPVDDGIARAEFDLAYSTVNEKRLEKLWLDLIFEGPQMNRITLRDVVLLRRPRADL